MANKRLFKLYGKSTLVMSVLIALLLSTSFVTTARSISQADPLTGAIWTTDAKGNRVNGNLFNNPRGVYLAGGPFKTFGLGLPDADYYFQVTDPAGKIICSTDDIANRKFTVAGGVISAVDGHDSKVDRKRGGLLVQLWPFDCTNVGGGFKVWVTRVEDWDGGFISSLSKTDNFKVKLEGALKYFELLVTDGVNEIFNVAYYVNYVTDEDPALWTSEQLFEDRVEDTLTVFRDGTTFPIGTTIHWEFEIYSNSDLLWASGIHGPELIIEDNMVNKEVVFRIDGHKYDADGFGLPGRQITLYRDGEPIDITLTDGNGYYFFIASFPGNYKVQSEGLATEEKGETWYEFVAEAGVDETFDFYDSHEIFNIGNLQDSEMFEFEVVFTPSNEDDGLWKLSSTNPGSFHLELNLEDMYDPGTGVTVEINLPCFGANTDPPDDFDSPNFILQHAYIGDTPTVDLHIYTDASMTWDITEDFIVDSDDGMVKHLRLSGEVPPSGSIFIRVHLDYQIDGSLTWEQVLLLRDFTYTFEAIVIDNVFGVHSVFGVH